MYYSLSLLSRRALIVLSIFLININPLSAASNEPVLVSNSNNIGIERFGITIDNEYIVFNEFDQNGVLNRFSRNLNNPDILINLRTGLSSIEDTFVFDNDDSRIFSIDQANGGFTRSSYDGQSTIELSAPNNETPVTFSGKISDTDFQVFVTSSRNLYSIASDQTSSATLLSEGLQVDRFRVTRADQLCFFQPRYHPTTKEYSAFP